MIEFNVPAMSCKHCVETVRRTVERVDPEASVEIDLATHRVRIESPASPQAFDSALAEEGYPPEA